MDIGALVHLLVVIGILGIVFYVLWWGLAKLALPEPWNKIGIAVLVLITVIVVLNYILLPLLGQPVRPFIR